MNEKMIEAAIDGNFTEFSDLLKEELNRRVHELIESRIQDVTDNTWNVCESCDEDDVWDDDDVEALYDDEEDPYEDEEEDLQGMNIGEGDDHDTRELHLYASNHADLHRQRMTPIHKNLRNKQASGTYDSEKAHKAFGHAAKDAADRYHKDHGHRFSVATRKAVAAKMRDEFESDSKDGEHDHLLHKKHKGHKVGESVEDMSEMPLVGTRSISRDEYKAMLAKAGTTRSSMKAKVKKGREDAKKSSESKKEEVEQVDELKRETLKSYKDKAKQDKNDIARLNQSNRGPLVGRDRRDFRNRSKGIDGATRRLISKQHEEVEQVDEKEDHVYHVSNIDYDADKRSKRRLPKKMKVRVPHDVHKDGQDAVDDHISDHISDTTGWLHKGYNSRRVKEEVEQVDELMMPAKDSEGRIKRGKIRAALRRGGQRARDAADKHYDAAANTHPDDHKGFVSSTEKAVDRDKVAKRRERAAEEVSVDEAMGGTLKQVRAQAEKNKKAAKKKKKLARKDHDGDGKIETGSQEFLGSRDKAIKAAIAARKGN